VSPASWSSAPAIRVAAPSDVDRVGDILAEAFADDPVISWLFRGPTHELARRAFFAFLAREYHVPLGVTYLVDGGCAAWSPPGAPAWPDERIARLRDLVAACAGADGVARHQWLGRALIDARPAEPHFYLGTLGTLPDRRGRGLGRALLSHGLAVVDAAGVAAYLEATNPRGVPFYQRHGFRPVEQLALPHGPVLTTMYRPAAPAGDRLAPETHEAPTAPTGPTEPR
jgi:ribosomal protein S18 acetylase RimI-like enzyme